MYGARMLTWKNESVCWYVASGAMLTSNDECEENGIYVVVPGKMDIRQEEKKQCQRFFSG